MSGPSFQPNGQFGDVQQLHCPMPEEVRPQYEDAVTKPLDTVGLSKNFGIGRRVKTKGPSSTPGPGTTTVVESNRGEAVPQDGAGSTQKAYAPPRSAQAAFLWLCAFTDSKFCMRCSLIAGVIVFVDVNHRERHVRFVPKADIGRCGREGAIR
jgi:hypothetical protein